MKPLTGIKVLEFCQVLSGPFCGMLLADLGAEVIKLERPPLGDSSRYNYPGVDGVSASYSYRNKGKKSVLMDLSDLRQRNLFYELVKDADIVLENYKPGTLEKYQCGYEDLKKINPEIILTSLSGFGQTGPMRNRAAYDILIQAESGLLSVTGTKEGELTSVGYSITDTIAGYNACVATLAALHGRSLTGKGTHIDIAMQDSTIVTMDTLYERYYLTGEIAGPLGVGNPLATPFRDYEIKDGKRLVICVTTEPQWSKFCKVLGMEDLILDPRFCSRELRRQNEEALNGYMLPLLKHREESELCAAFDQVGITYGHINNIKDVVSSEQFKARNLMAHVTYPDKDVSIPITAHAIKMTDLEEESDYVAYTLGYNTFEVLENYMDSAALHEIYDSVMEESIKAAEDTQIKGGILKR